MKVGRSSGQTIDHYIVYLAIFGLFAQISCEGNLRWWRLRTRINQSMFNQSGKSKQARLGLLDFN